MRLILGLILIVLLPRNYALGDQAGPALRGHAGQFRVGFALLVIGQRLVHRRPRLLQIGLRLTNLLLHFRRFDFGHGLAGLDAVADVHHAAQDVSIGARQNGRLGDCLYVAGQLQHALARGARHFDHFYTRQRALLFVRFARDHRSALLQRNIPGEKRHHDDRKHREEDRPDGNGGRLPKPSRHSGFRPALGGAFQFGELPPEFLILPL